MLLSSDIEKCTNQQDLSLKYFVAHMNSLYYQQHNWASSLKKKNPVYSGGVLISSGEMEAIAIALFLLFAERIMH